MGTFNPSTGFNVDTFIANNSLSEFFVWAWGISAGSSTNNFSWVDDHEYPIRTLSITGSFEYQNPDGTPSSGVITGLSYKEDDKTLFSVSGVSVTVEQLYAFSDANNLAGLFQALLVGNDTMFAPSGSETLHGYDGNDVMLGGAGDDTLYGDNGNDLMSGGTGNDSLYGGVGADILSEGSSSTGIYGNDRYDGGTGRDEVIYSATGPGVTVNLTNTGQQNTGQGVDTLVSIENVLATAGNDQITGNAQSNWISTSGGNDTISAADGDDLIWMGAGDKVVDGGSGIDTVMYSDTNTQTYQNAGGISVSLAIQGQAQSVGTGSWTLNGIENLGGAELHDTLTGNGNANVLSGGLGNDQLAGGDGDDQLYGDGVWTVDANGDQKLVAVDPGGLGGDDVLTGGAGSDVLTGGAGNDTFHDSAAGLSGDTITDFGIGDRIIITDASFATFAFNVSSNILTYSGGSLTLVAPVAGRIVASAATGGGVQLVIQPIRDAANDFNGDGRSDIMFRHDNGAITNFLGTANGGILNNGDNVYSVVDNAWGLAGTGDFNGDGRDDVLWRNDNGAVFNFLGTANGGVTNNGDNSFLQLNAGWTVSGIGDFNGDGRDDILFRDANGVIFDYLGTASGGFTANTSNLYTDIADAWHVSGVGDFNGDGRDDILFRNDNGAITNFLGTANGGIVNNGDNIYTVVDNAWHIAGVGDFNGDGRDDMLWRNDNGAVFTFLSTANGGVINNGDNSYAAMSNVWHVEAIGDYNGDGRDDILWRHDNGTVIDWLGTASGGFTDNSGNLFTSIALAWQVTPADVLI